MHNLKHCSETPITYLQYSPSLFGSTRLRSAQSSSFLLHENRLTDPIYSKDHGENFALGYYFFQSAYIYQPQTPQFSFHYTSPEHKITEG